MSHWRPLVSQVQYVKLCAIQMFLSINWWGRALCGRVGLRPSILKPKLIHINVHSSEDRKTVYNRSPIALWVRYRRALRHLSYMPPATATQTDLLWTQYHFTFTVIFWHSDNIWRVHNFICDGIYELASMFMRYSTNGLYEVQCHQDAKSA